jgi:hypothetical protein
MAIYLPPKSTGEWIDLTGYNPGYSSYVDFLEGFTAPAYKKIRDLIFFRGVIEKDRSIADDSGIVLILPAGIRPTSNGNYPLTFGASASVSDFLTYLRIKPNGELIITRNTSAILYFNLDGISFAI